MAFEDYDQLLSTLRDRFAMYPDRHRGVEWEDVFSLLKNDEVKLNTLWKMEESGGEPDILWPCPGTELFYFYDCSPESPSGRRSLCYDQMALESRRDNKPRGSAWNTAAAMGIELLTEDEYRMLQEFGEFDLKTSSWVNTPEEIRTLGGALFCDRRYNHVFVYHNGAESYYAARGFRGKLGV